VVSLSHIKKFSKSIAQEFRPKQIILFGSYAYGKPTPESDVDLLIILPFKGKSQRKSLEILEKIKPSFPVDLLVRTPEEIHKRLSWNDFFLQEIMKKGKVLYETSDP